MKGKAGKNKHTVFLSQEKWLEVKKSSDNELVKMIQRDDPRTYRELVKRYRNKMFAYLYRMVGNKDEVEDLLQNVFIKVYRNINRFDTERKFSSWIYRIAHNEAVNYLKKKGRKHFVSLEDIETTKDKLDTASLAKSPIDAWISKELKKEMLEALDKLPPKYKEVLILRYFLDKSYDEMSEILGKPVNTVGTLLNRAKNKLMQIIKVSWK
jgi:RNA polymerase sigma-70 factor, ECF subfamily